MPKTNSEKNSIGHKNHEFIQPVVVQNSAKQIAIWSMASWFRLATDDWCVYIDWTGNLKNNHGKPKNRE